MEYEDHSPEYGDGRAELGAVLADTVGVPQSGVDVCHALLVEDLLSVADIAACTDRDGATVRRHLQRLVAAGLLGRADLPREGGGTVAVYHVADRGRPETLAEFCVWAARAAGEPVPDATDPFGDAAAAFRGAF